MPKAADGPSVGNEAELTAEAVRAWIKRNPDFLAENSDLLSLLAVEREDEPEGVVNLQNYIVDGLRKSLKQRENREREILIAAEERARGVTRTHDAALMALRQRNFGALAERVAAGFPVTLGASAAVLVIEGQPDPNAREALALDTLEIESLIGPDETIHMGRLSDAGRSVLSERFAIVESIAVVRLESSRRQAFLVLGSSAETDFHPDHGTELLAFLGGVMSLAIDRWSRPQR